MHRRLMASLILILACLPVARLSAQSTQPSAEDVSTRRPIAALQLDGKGLVPPTIDGDLADPIWKVAPKATLFFDRQQGTRAPDQTIAWLAYDDKYIYVAFHCKDSQPNQIVARETVRDQKYENDDREAEDNIEVVFDPFLSRREDDFAKFSVNPLGTKSSRITGGRAGKAEWKGDWDAGAKRVEDGWTCEMRIPWSILSYPKGKKSLTIGVNFWRWQDRTKIQSVWSNVGQQRHNELEGIWADVQVPQNAFRPTLSLLPYALPGFDRDRATFRSGLDARYTITPEMTAVGTINPDFGTIEGAVQSINFSRSEQFVPERRPFFQEGRDYFDAGTFYALGPFFYPRRIENFDVGTKIYGKVTPKDTVGFLHTLDFYNRSDLVTRYSHNLSDTANLALFFAQKSARDDNNTVGVLQQNARWGKFGFETQLGISTGQAAGGGAKEFNWTYSDTNHFTSLQYLDVSPLFRDAEGLIFFNDFRGFSLYDSWYAEWRKGFWRNFGVDFNPNWDWHTDGRPFRRGGSIDFGFETRSDWRFRLGMTYQKFDDQIDNTFTFVIRQGVSNRFRQWGLQMQTGRQGDRPYSFIGPELRLRVLRKLDLAYGGAVQNLDGGAQQHVMTMNYELSPTRSFGGRVVVQDADTNWYISYRNSGEKGTETFFIIGDPNARRFARQMRVKFVFAI